MSAGDVRAGAERSAALPRSTIEGGAAAVAAPPDASRPVGRRRALTAAAVIGMAVVAAGAAAYGWLRYSGRDLDLRLLTEHGARVDTASPEPAGPIIWDGLDPAQVAAARRAFDQQIATEEREAIDRARRASSP